MAFSYLSGKLELTNLNDETNLSGLREEIMEAVKTVLLNNGHTKAGVELNSVETDDIEEWDEDEDEDEDDEDDEDEDEDEDDEDEFEEEEDTGDFDPIYDYDGFPI